MIALLAILSFTPSANASDLDQATLDALARQQAEIQDLQAERDALRAQCAKECKPVAPAPRPKATKLTTPKATTAPKPAPAPAVDPKIAELEAEIAFLKGQLEKPIYVTVEAPNVDIHPTVVEHTEHTETVRVSGTRFHIGLAESVTGAPALPGSDLVAVDLTQAFGRVEWNLVGDNWITMRISGGYGFAGDSTSLQGLLGYTRNLGDVDLNVGVGPTYRCDDAFTNGRLCTNSLFGAMGQGGVAFQAFGPVNVDLAIGGGYTAVDSKIAGLGGQGFGLVTAGAFWGEVGHRGSARVH